MTESHLPDDIEEQLSRTLGARVADMRARPGLVAAVADRAARRRRQTTGIALPIAAAVAVGAVAISLSVVPGSDRVTPAAPSSTTGSPAPGLPPDTLTVGLRGIAVSVPDSWSVVDSDDECAPVRLDRVIAGTGLCSNGRVGGHLGTAVVLAPLDSPDGRDVEGAIGEVSKGADFGPEAVNDLSVESTGTACGGSGDSVLFCSNDLVIRESAIVVRIDARSRKAVDAIVATVRSVPQGYTVVPDLGDLSRDLPPADGVVVALAEAGLEVDGTPSGFAQSVVPDPGTTVPLGSTVALTTTPYRKGPPPAATSDKVKGTWSVHVPGVTDFDGPLPTMTLQGGVMTADDGCTQIGGRYTIAGVDIIFDKNTIESTQAACDLTTALIARIDRVRHLTFRPGDELYLHASNGEIILVLRRA